jgi:hypothetical protein
VVAPSRRNPILLPSRLSVPFLAEVVRLAAAGRTTFRGPLIVARCDFALHLRLLPTRLVQLMNFGVGECMALNVNVVHRPGRKVHVPH